ncbi:uncharacterized protein MKK02DRAFT_16844 [Dioszegia hungarica]|uniref:Nuclear rim protein 1 n=1 Tax=Dioszegia hungarica TaxID=4972 RepID=A0AA38H7P5_9TREE|nr:uncharacterized protein MKK02DRAFT_16844 [Dioszegia hungarica]KAI9634346.1 hypothetical protein MKK02DRAFT_16844 [Dioszegia hungarica]
MSQSPLQRSTRRSLPAFAHTPSRLSKPASSSDLAPRASTSNSTSYATPPPARLQYNEEANLRRTPIYYSPQALSTPPAGLSKSASIPFDMAASAKAARTAAASSSTRDMGVDGDGGAGPSEKKKRFVRQKSIFQRIADYPQHVVDMFLLLSPTSMLDLLPDERYAHPIVLGIQAVHFLCTASFWTSKAEETSILRSSAERRGVGGRWGKWEDEQRSQRFLGGWGVFVFTLLLFALASANAIYLFSRFRTYDMQLRSAQETPVSPHASSVKSPRSTSSDDPFTPDTPAERKDETPGMKVARIGWKVTVFLVKGSYAAIRSMLGRPSSGPPQGYANEDRIQSLRVWDPPDFCLAFFCAYPPTAPLQTHLLTPLHPLLTPLLHLTSALLLSYLSQHFRQLVRDRMVLSAEVMREYDRRFVYKRVFASRVDRASQTEQAESVW